VHDSIQPDVSIDSTVLRLTVLPDDRLAELVADSEYDGYRFVRRLVAEWENGANRFERPGEVLLGAVRGCQIVGVCGLNVDPYAAMPEIGRVRHLYVLAAHRRTGIGSKLVATVVKKARATFTRLRLRTGTPEAARFYEGLGFRRAAGEADCTHVLEMQPKA
jgi:GNAT superfamily N-acetyltransferase